MVAIKKILIMGLPGSGKTTLAKLLTPQLKAAWFNADLVREHIHKDLSFSLNDRLEHARRMGKLADWASQGGNYVICDFCCPTEEARALFNPDVTIWLDRIKEGRFEDTNHLFENPTRDKRWSDKDLMLTSGTPEMWCEQVIAHLSRLSQSSTWQNQHPTALLIGRYQPFHQGHQLLVEEAIKRVGQCCIGLRDVGGIDENNPYHFDAVKAEIYEACAAFKDKLLVIEMPNITNVYYGRGVGYSIEEIILDEGIQQISATKIRAGEIDKKGQIIPGK